jgi:hypothetical protein
VSQASGCMCNIPRRRTFDLGLDTPTKAFGNRPTDKRTRLLDVERGHGARHPIHVAQRRLGASLQRAVHLLGCIGVCVFFYVSDRGLASLEESFKAYERFCMHACMYVPTDRPTWPSCIRTKMSRVKDG